MSTVKAIITSMVVVALTACGSRDFRSLSTYESYEAEQQCAESVPRVLKYNDGNPLRGNPEAVLAHYNASLNMCFVAVQMPPLNVSRGDKPQWIIVSAQSYLWLPIEMNDSTWKRLMESGDLDSIASGTK